MGWKKACSKGKESKELNKSLEKDVLAYLTPSSDIDVTIYEHKSLGVLALHLAIQPMHAVIQVLIHIISKYK